MTDWLPCDKLTTAPWVFLPSPRPLVSDCAVGRLC